MIKMEEDLITYRHNGITFVAQPDTKTVMIEVTNMFTHDTEIKDRKDLINAVINFNANENLWHKARDIMEKSNIIHHTQVPQDNDDPEDYFQRIKNQLMVMEANEVFEDFLWEIKCVLANLVGVELISGERFKFKSTTHSFETDLKGKILMR